MVQDFADEDRNPGRETLITPKLLELLNGLVIAFDDFAVSLFVQETIDLDVKVADILLGPFESFRDPF